MLHLKGLDATLESKLDSANPSDMAADGSCGGEELPKGATRTMRLTDYRASTCTPKPARVVAAVTSTFEGKTNPIGTFFRVDKHSRAGFGATARVMSKIRLAING